MDITLDVYTVCEEQFISELKYDVFKSVEIGFYVDHSTPPLMIQLCCICCPGFCCCCCCCCACCVCDWDFGLGILARMADISFRSSNDFHRSYRARMYLQIS